MTGSWSGEMKKVWRRLSPFSADEGGSSWRRRAAGLAPEAKAAGSTTNSNLIGADNPIYSPQIQVVAKLRPWFLGGTPSTKYISPRRCSGPAFVTNLASEVTVVRGSGGLHVLRNLVFQVSHLVFCSTKVLSIKTPS